MALANLKTAVFVSIPSASITSMNDGFILTKMADIPHRVNGGMLLIKYNKQRGHSDAASQCSAV